ncbi:MAG TPA: sensor domain-containing protein [Methylomirabilota bacterium]|nr:sensor domain-containing protein [Methylomirabilota bacterium]
MIARLQRELVDPRTYGRIGYLLVAGLLGVTEFVFLVVAISVGVGLAITLIGIPILILAVYAWGGLAEGERRIIAALTGKVIPNPYRPVPEGASRWGRLRARLADPATWKDLTFLLLQFPFGLVSFLLAVCILSIGIHLVALPLWYWAVPGGVDDGIVTVDQLWEALALVPLGVAILLLGIPALSALGRLYVSYAEVLLGSNVDPAVTAQMSDLRDARSRIIEAADAERRRIERDLHDGAQQRLVALALTLRMAEKRAGEGNPEAAGLVRQAGEEAGLALRELRDLARGIHPAILTNRGLPAALDDLAGRASVPVEVVATPPERLPDQVEAAAYFVVSECLANIGKHAQATAAEVSVTPRQGHLLVTVSDDGVGGANLDGGSGLQGLQDRVGALDGTLAVESGPSGGTRVLATIPLVERSETAGFGPLPERVLSDAEADQLQDRRRRGLRIRASLLGMVALVIVAVWALTGAPNAWPVWPLLGLGLVVALDAWQVLGIRPARRSDLAGEPNPRALQRRRGLRAAAGKLAIVNVFLIGIWIAGGAGYFWPAWVMLGSCVALGLKAAPWPHNWVERVQA